MRCSLSERKAGYVQRAGYTRKAYRRQDGTLVKAVRVSPVCIRRQGSSAPRIKASPKVVPRGRCPKGQLLRAGKSPVCIKDRGLPGRGQERIQAKYQLRKGALAQLGYDVDDSLANRREALSEAFESGRTKTNLVGMLNAQYVYRKNEPIGSKAYRLGQRFKKDRDFVSSL